MTYEIVSVQCQGTGFEAPGENLVFRWLDNRCNHYSPCQLYQKALETSKSDIIMYAHDDLIIHDPDWLERVLAPFENENTLAVGLGGADRLGLNCLYKVPYDIRNMARGGYNSNQDDAEVHGGRVSGSRRVAVLDAFFMAVRRHPLLAFGGWPVKHLTHHCLDLWLACEGANNGWDTYMVGVSCLHKGGGTSIKTDYSEAKWLQGGTVDLDHQMPHRWLYEMYRLALPIEVQQ